MARREYRITTSAFGSFSPAPWHDAADGEGVLLTTYDRRGYRVAAQRVADSTLIPVAPSKLPLNVVNPERKRWDVVNLDTVRFTGADSLRQCGTFRARRYRKVPNLVNVHSWMPVAFNPFDAVDEHNINLNPVSYTHLVADAHRRLEVDERKDVLRGELRRVGVPEEQRVDRAGIFMHETHEIEDPGIVLGGLDADVVQRGGVAEEILGGVGVGVEHVAGDVYKRQPLFRACCGTDQSRG